MFCRFGANIYTGISGVGVSVFCFAGRLHGRIARMVGKFVGSVVAGSIGIAVLTLLCGVRCGFISHLCLAWHSPSMSMVVLMI